MLFSWQSSANSWLSVDSSWLKTVDKMEWNFNSRKVVFLHLYIHIYSTHALTWKKPLYKSETRVCKCCDNDKKTKNTKFSWRILKLYIKRRKTVTEDVNQYIYILENIRTTSKGNCSIYSKRSYWFCHCKTTHYPRNSPFENSKCQQTQTCNTSKI